MKGKQLSRFSSILMIISAILVMLALFFPWWRMEFFAPQYPEGLNIIVYPDHLEGELEQINGLNHYIGMAQFNEESFPELNYLPYLIGGLSIFVLLGAFIRKKAYLISLIVIFLIGGAVGVWDLWAALKEYGTNLDPMAPIEMEPFVPPIIGENVVANFTTYSLLGIGAYLVIAAFILLLIPLWKDRKQ